MNRAASRTVTTVLTRVLPGVWALVLSVLLLGPALGPGYVLSYDMVWVPNLSLHPDVFGLGSGLPRAVPSDAVVALLDEVVPGMLLQKLVLLGGLVLAGTGAARLVAPVGRRALAARLAAVSVTVWSPFVVERLWIGHWPMLLAYAAVPWLAVAGCRAASDGHIPRWTYVVLLVGSLSANAGLVTGLVLLATGVRRGAGVTVRLLVAVVAANLPWAVAGLAHAAIATSAAGYQVFGLHGDGLPAPLAAVTLGGVWNAAVVPASRGGWLAWVGLAFVVGLAVAGVRRWAAWTRADQRVALVALWLLGFGIAVVSWAAPDALAWLGDHVPGAGALRDGSRMLPLCLPLLVTLVGAGADRVVSALGGLPSRIPALAGVVVVVLVPVGVLPDATGGISGALRAVDFPADWRAAATVVDRSGLPGDVLVLPWSAYRAPVWNGRRPVLDPMPRLLDRDSVVDDDLVIDGRDVPGEDPRARRIGAALDLPTPTERDRALAAEGIGLVVVERDAGAVPSLPGPLLHESPTVKVIRVEAPVVSDASAVRGAARAAVVVAWLAYAVLWLVALAQLVARRRTAATVRREGEGGHIG